MFVDLAQSNERWRNRRVEAFRELLSMIVRSCSLSSLLRFQYRFGAVEKAILASRKRREGERQTEVAKRAADSVSSVMIQGSFQHLLVQVHNFQLFFVFLSSDLHIAIEAERGA